MPLEPFVIMIYSQISGMKKQHTIDISRQDKTYVVSAHWEHPTETERLQMTTTTISWRKRRKKYQNFWWTSKAP